MKNSPHFPHFSIRIFLSLSLSLSLFLSLFAQNVTIKKNANNDNLIWPLNPSQSIYVGEGAGNVSTGLFNTGVGAFALNLNTTGSSNSAFGNGTLGKVTTGGLNTAMGVSAMYENLTGTENTAFGTFSLNNNKGRGRSIAIGYKSMYYANNATSAGSTYNIAVGYEALNGSVNPANNTGIKNTAMGDQVMYSNTSGSTNAAYGFNAMYSNTTGFSNVAIGNLSLYSNTIRTNLVAIGDSALYKNGIGVTQSYEAIFNTGVGSKALANNTTGYQNTAIGFQALINSTTGGNNTALGSQALYGNTTGSVNTALGNKSLSSSNPGSFNTTAGYGAMQFSTTSNSNVAIGYLSMQNSVNRSNLVAVGDSALYKNGTGATQSFEAILNTAIGTKALAGNTIGYQNTALGAQTMLTNTTGSNNTGLGAGALYYNNNGSLNTAAGNKAMGANTSGTGNTASGYSVMQSNNTGNQNVAFGKEALYSNTVGDDNVALGYEAGRSSTGSGNVFLGNKAGWFETGNNKLYVANNNATSTSALLYGEFDNKYLKENGRMEIISNVADEPAFKASAPVTELGPVISALATLPGLGVGVTGAGGIGVWGVATSNGNDDAIGIAGASVSVNAGTNKGVTGVASGGAINYAGYFQGNTYVDTRLGIHINPTHEIHVKQAGSSSAYGIKTESVNNTNNWVTNIDVADDYNFYFNGTLRAYILDTDGTYHTSSDRRLKKDLEPLPSVLQDVLALQPTKFHYNDCNDPSSKKTVGFIAQEVQEHFPDVVGEKNGYLSIGYDGLIPIAFKAIQEQQKIIDTQEERIAKLEALVQELVAKSK